MWSHAFMTSIRTTPRACSLEVRRDFLPRALHRPHSFPFCSNSLSAQWTPIPTGTSVSSSPRLHCPQSPPSSGGYFSNLFSFRFTFVRVPFPKRNPLFRPARQILFLATLHQPTFLGNYFSYWQTCLSLLHNNPFRN